MALFAEFRIRKNCPSGASGKIGEGFQGNGAAFLIRHRISLDRYTGKPIY
jgi:hypothetical protein